MEAATINRDITFHYQLGLVFQYTEEVPESDRTTKRGGGDR